jgi:energy-coupling factor transporter ATP-binding protein EcfA2
MPPSRSFQEHNLRWNPFEELPLKERANLAVDVPSLSLHFGEAIVFLGEKGRGKTTHLLALHAQHPNAPYVHLPEFGAQPRIPKADLIFLDEAQRLPRLFRPQLWKRARAWVIASHQDHRHELERAGFAVRVLHLHGLSLSKLERIVQNRLEWARRDVGAVPTVPTIVLQTLLEQYGDDLRAIEDALYLWFQTKYHPKM